jgi:hypothetical protein
VTGFHPVFRVAPSGRLVIELVVQYMQQDNSRKGALAGLPGRGGTTVIAGFDGRIRYVIARPVSDDGQPPEVAQATRERFERQARFMLRMDRRDPLVGYMSDVDYNQRMALRASLSALHLSR